jgi:hypothetical protein
VHIVAEDDEICVLSWTVAVELHGVHLGVVKRDYNLVLVWVD